ncbi:hypothetical protein [Zoogloea sp.]
MRRARDKSPLTDLQLMHWIKVIKRMAYGFRDSAYFFLKIKAAFPGKAR